MSLINWIFDAYQHSKIDRAHREATELRAEVAALRSQGGQLDNPGIETAIGQLALAVKTLQRMMIEKGVCTQEELRAMADAIDREDGRADGQSPIS